MKHLRLLLFLLLPGACGAGGLNLAWNNCFPSAGAAQDQVFLCDDSEPGANDANNQSFDLYGSVVTGYDIPGVIAWGATLTIVEDAFYGYPPIPSTWVPPDWWGFGEGECRGSPSAVSFAYRQFSNSTSCEKNLMNHNDALSISLWSTEPDYHRARYWFGVVRPVGVNVAAGTEYQLFRVHIDTHDTKVSPVDGTTVSCAGCRGRLAIVFSEAEIDVPVSQQPPDGKNLFYVPYQRQFVTWQDRLETPAARPTWGRLRRMYR